MLLLKQLETVASRDRPKTDFPFTAENETGVENGSSFSAVNENENETDEKYSLGLELVTTRASRITEVEATESITCNDGVRQHVDNY